ncbi:MAG: hypothetical protein Q4G69_11980 [Planctomycetia bacterium]|nr:hypothetical protein [Planctomycetia bacterium]
MFVKKYLNLIFRKKQSEGISLTEEERDVLRKITRTGSVLTFVLLIAFLILTLTGLTKTGGILLILFWILLALLMRGYETTKAFCYPLLVLGCVTSNMYFPGIYLNWFGVKTTALVIPILQIIMFGMGTQLALKDFRQIMTAPGLFLLEPLRSL